MKKTPLKRKSKSPLAIAKDSIQASLRAKAIKRDGGCVMRHYGDQIPTMYVECGPRRKDGELILQAEHLITRSNSASYADMDNIVCLCQRHHKWFKEQHGAIYWNIIQQHIGEDRWEKVQKWGADYAPHRVHLSEWERIAQELNK